ncbi:MAG TPA: hypothetical protein PKC59_14910 [Burkholderiaceae bacterium]|nr:hypothetical protein [Burkholderiaceae bacterium]
MRKDMAKVLIEVYRRGATASRSLTGRRRLYRNAMDPDGEGGPVRLPMMMDIGCRWALKERCERIGALERYLIRQVGRPWDVVYGEICAIADLRSTVQWHLRLHLEFLVETQAVWIGGEVRLPADQRHASVDRSCKTVFVHPLTGLLCAVPARR